MSRTDKDAPYRVHLARSGRERHDHSLGFCDYEPKQTEVDKAAWTGPYRYRRACGLEIPGRYFYTLQFYGSRTKLYQYFAREMADRDNARVRSTLASIRKLHRAGEDIEFEDVPNYQYRHTAAWEVW